MEISIKSAAEMVKVSRNTIYQAIRDGKISRGVTGKVDTSELLRVFGNPADRHTRAEEIEHIEQLKNTLNTEQIEHKNEQNTERQLNTLNSEKEVLYQARIKSLEDELNHAREREQWQRGHIDKLTDAIKLLEAPIEDNKPIQKKRGFWSRLFRKTDSK